MKKSFLRMMSLAVVLMFMASMFTFTAFAANEEPVSPAASVCGHTTTIAYDEDAVYSDNLTHIVTTYRILNCKICGYTETIAVDDYYEEHYSSRVWQQIPGTDLYYRTCDGCDHVYYRGTT